MQVNDLWTAVSGLASGFTVLGVFVAGGMFIQQLRTISRVLERVEERLTDHIEDRDLHPDVPDLDRRLDRIERRQGH